MKREQEASGADKAQAGADGRTKAKEGAPAPSRRPLIGLQRAAGNQAVAASMAATRSTPVQRAVSSNPVVVQRAGELDDALRKLAESQNLNYDDLAQALVKMAASQGSVSGSSGGGTSSSTKAGTTTAKTPEETKKQKLEDIASLQNQIKAAERGESTEKAMNPDEQLDAEKTRLQNRLKFVKDRKTKERRNAGLQAMDEDSVNQRELAKLDRENDEAGYNRRISGNLTADEREADELAELKDESSEIYQRERARKKRERELTYAQQDLNDESMIEESAKLKMLKEDQQLKEQWALNGMKNKRDFQANFVQNNATANNPLLAQWANLKKKK